MKILAVDYGDSRTGLATCDRTEFLTTAITPQITLKARNKVAARVCEVAKEIGAELIVIGLPLNMDGTEGERAIKSRKLAKTVEIWSGLPVRMWDERQTTCAAADILDESGTFGTKRKEILDSVSATVILDDYLAWRKEHPGEIRFNSFRHRWRDATAPLFVTCVTSSPGRGKSFSLREALAKRKTLPHCQGLPH